MLRILLILGLILPINIANAATSEVDLLHRKWPFEGILGSFDRASIQRGYQVYKEVCASCHSMKRVYYRNLIEVGFSEAEAKTLAASHEVTDGPDDFGDMYQRPAKLSDKFAMPYPNENAARAANGGAYPPDLSLIIKARPDGANYVYSLLNGYDTAPSHMKMGEGMNYNSYYPGYQIAMAQPLYDDQVAYMDGTDATIKQMSYDIVNFLQWAAEPEMEERKSMGISVLIFLFITTIFFYIAKRRIWKKVS